MFGSPSSRRGAAEEYAVVPLSLASLSGPAVSLGSGPEMIAIHAVTGVEIPEADYPFILCQRTSVVRRRRFELRTR
jgi:hypothetical protein